MSKSLVIMAAGLGSRYGSIKQIERVGPHGEILMEYAIYDALKAGFDKIVIVIKQEMLCDMKELIGKRIEQSTGTGILYAVQDTSNSCCGLAVPGARTKPLGTAHAILCASPFIDGPFAVINADDFYGREAFEALHGALSSLSSAQESAMIGYRLENTLSPNGSVTRGVCIAEDGFLRKVRETYKIRLMPDGSIRDCSFAEGEPLDPDCFVSMNMWAFHRDLLDEAKAYFARFLAGLAEDDNSSECLLPLMVDELLSCGKTATYVIPTEEKWFGLTYKEDRAEVAARLSELHSAGVYPASLW